MNADGPADELEPLRAPAASGVPIAALAVYARWWQLETYLRELVYTELRAAYGTAWVDHIGERASYRAEEDRVNAYMASADADELLAYADVGRLFTLITDNWELFAPVLIPRQRWEGLVDLLTSIRNRVGHCRRPHADDQGRLEQTLRDLEPGAREFYRSYAAVTHPSPKAKDPLVKAWLGFRHEDAVRLVEHCREQYDVHFALGYSVRPWAEDPGSENSISGSAGLLWQARWIFRDRKVRPVDVWPELSRSVRELLVHMVFDYASVTVSFAAVDDPAPIADAIGHVFDCLVTESRPMTLPEPGESFLAGADEWRQGADQLPPKVQVASTLALFDPYNSGAFSIFSA